MKQFLFSLFMAFSLSCSFASQTYAETFSENHDLNQTRRLSLAEIRERLMNVTPEGKNEIDVSKFAKENIFQKALYAIQQLQHYQGKEAIELVMLGFSSYSDSLRAEAMNALAVQNHEAIFPVFRFLILREKLPDDHPAAKWKVGYDITLAERAAKLLANHSEHPLAVAIMKEGLAKLTKEQPIIRRYLSKTLSQCRSMECFEIARKLIKTTKDPFEKANYYLSAQHFLNYPEGHKLVEEGINSTEHPIKMAAAKAMIGTKDLSLLPLIEIASVALVTWTRLNAIAALRDIASPKVFSIYREGLLDSSIQVRFFTMSELARRSEPMGLILLQSVAQGETTSKIRTPQEQYDRASFSEYFAETRRNLAAKARHSFGKMIPPDIMNPNVGFMEAFHDKSIAGRIEMMIKRGYSEESIALKLIQSRNAQAKTEPSSLKQQDGFLIEDGLVYSEPREANNSCKLFYN